MTTNESIETEESTLPQWFIVHTYSGHGYGGPGYLTNTNLLGGTQSGDPACIGDGISDEDSIGNGAGPDRVLDRAWVQLGSAHRGASSDG